MNKKDKRRLLYEWWKKYPEFLKEKPDIAKISGRKLLNLYIEKQGSEEKALEELIMLNGTKDVHTVFCESCWFRILPSEEKMGMVVRGKALCYKHQVSFK